MNALLLFSDRLEAISVRIGRLAAWSAILLILVIVGDVILRRYFVLGSTRLQEMEWHIHGFLFLTCMGFAYAKGAHVRIELFRDHWSDKTKIIIELLGGLMLLIPYCFVVIKFGFDYAAMSLANNEASPTSTGLPMRWIIKSVLVAGFVLVALPAISTTLRAVVWLATGNEGARKSMSTMLSDDQETA